MHYKKITKRINRANLLIIRSQFSNSDGHPIRIAELCVDADPLPPPAAAKQHHLADAWWNCNTDPSRAFSADTAKQTKKQANKGTLLDLHAEKREAKSIYCFKEREVKRLCVNRSNSKRRQ